MSKQPTSIAELNETQIYVGREMIDDYQAGFIDRRTLLRRLTLICGSAMGGAALLSACGDSQNAEMILNPPPGNPDAGAGATASQDAGSRSAALSVSANDPAVQGSRVQYDSLGGARVTGYLARPSDASKSYPGVVVIHENRGLNDHIRDVARRLAKAGFIALAPDLTSRQGSTETLSPEMAQAALSNTPEADLVADLKAGADFLSTQAGVSTPDRLGVTGFCFGGGQTYRLTVASPRIAAAASYYGPIAMPLIEELRNVNAAILVHHAESDDRVNATTDAMIAALTAAGKTFRVVSHPGTMHAFNNDTGDRYNEAAAVAAWTQTIDWFNTHLRRA